MNFIPQGRWILLLYHPVYKSRSVLISIWIKKAALMATSGPSKAKHSADKEDTFSEISGFLISTHAMKNSGMMEIWCLGDRSVERGRDGRRISSARIGSPRARALTRQHSQPSLQRRARPFARAGFNGNVFYFHWATNCTWPYWLGSGLVSVNQHLYWLLICSWNANSY